MWSQLSYLQNVARKKRIALTYSQVRPIVNWLILYGFYVSLRVDAVLLCQRIRIYWAPVEEIEIKESLINESLADKMEMWGGCCFLEVSNVSQSVYLTDVSLCGMEKISDPDSAHPVNYAFLLAAALLLVI